MITKKQYESLVERARKREQDLMDAIRDTLQWKAQEDSDKPVFDLDDLDC